MKKAKLEKVTNRIILEMTPVDKYAELFDENIPTLFADMIKWLEQTSREEMRGAFDISFLRNWSDDYLAEHKQELLPYLIYNYGSEFDCLFKFYNSISDELAEEIDIYLYFFSQYRRVTGEDLDTNMSFEDIVKKYRKLDESALDKYVFTGEYVLGKGKVKAEHFKIIILPEKEKEFERIAEGLDLYVPKDKRDLFDSLQEDKTVIEEVKHLRICDAIRHYLEQIFDEYWNVRVLEYPPEFCVESDTDRNNAIKLKSLDEGKRSGEELVWPFDDEPPENFGVCAESNTDNNTLELEEILVDWPLEGNKTNYYSDRLFEEPLELKYLKDRLWSRFRTWEWIFEYDGAGNNAMVFASRFFERRLYVYLPYINRRRWKFKSKYELNMGKIYDATETSLEIYAHSLCEELMLQNDNAEIINLLDNMEDDIEKTMQNITCNIGSDDSINIKNVDSLSFADEDTLKYILFKLYSSSDMQYILLTMFRLKKDEESFRRIIFWISAHMSYMVDVRRHDNIFEYDMLIDVYLLIVKEIINFYTPMFEQIRRKDNANRFDKPDNPYVAYENYELIALYAADLIYKESSNHSDKSENSYVNDEESDFVDLYIDDFVRNNAKPSDSLLIQQHIYMCANNFDLFSTVLSVNNILLEIVKKEESFIPKNFADRIEQISDEYRRFYVSMIENVFVDYNLTHEYASLQYIKTIEDEVDNTETNISFLNMLDTLQSIADAEALTPEEISESKRIVLKTANMFGVRQERIDVFINKLVSKLTENNTSNEKYLDIYNSIKNELVEIRDDIDLSIVKTLATAEYFYSIYIDEMDEIRDFDYSCFTMLYYRCFEEALNIYLYIPYKERFEKEAIHRIEKNGKNDCPIDIVPRNVKGIICYSKRRKEYFFTESLTMGGMAHFCKGISESKSSTLNKWLNNKCKNISELKSLGEEIVEVSPKRNYAAHGNGILPAQALIDSKNYVYNKAYSQKLRNMLMRFLELIKE